jgi:hypothetical protein
LLNKLAELRHKHLAGVANLLQAIAADRVETYPERQFSWPN